MKAWWLNEYECWAGESLEEALADWEKETGCRLDDDEREDCHEANYDTRVNMCDEDTSLEEMHNGPFKTIGELVAAMDKPGYVCGYDT
jgi:hypothetical protein